MTQTLLASSGSKTHMWISRACRC